MISADPATELYYKTVPLADSQIIYILTSNLDHKCERHCLTYYPNVFSHILLSTNIHIFFKIMQDEDCNS